MSFVFVLILSDETKNTSLKKVVGWALGMFFFARGRGNEWDGETILKAVFFFCTFGAVGEFATTDEHGCRLGEPCISMFIRG